MHKLQRVKMERKRLVFSHKLVPTWALCLLLSSAEKDMSGQTFCVSSGRERVCSAYAQILFLGARSDVLIWSNFAATMKSFMLKPPAFKWKLFKALYSSNIICCESETCLIAAVRWWPQTISMAFSHWEKKML